MTISLTRGQEARLQKLIDAGKFESAEHFIDYSLHAVDVEGDLLEDDAFADYVRAKLKEAQDDIDNKQVRRYTKENHHELFDDIKRRGMKRLKTKEPQAG
jgi:Arc/MetJ-type ribon-helix-helix transcriptional regulator